MRKSIYLLTTTPSSHTHLLLTTPTSHTNRFHPPSTIVIHTLNFAQVKSMDDNCVEWVECMGVVSRRWLWLVGVGGICGCGCKDYLSLLLLYLFFFSCSINTHTGNYGCTLCFQCCHSFGFSPNNSDF